MPRRPRTSRPPISEHARLSSSKHQLDGTGLAGVLGPGTQGKHYRGDPVDRERTVQRPIPQRQLEDPREFQLGQIRRRFSPSEQADGDTQTLVFSLTPSDPDFPFDITTLECKLSVPSTYPHGDVPRLRVLNKEMSRGYQINVERGFDELYSNNRNATLLGLMNRLDQQLERLLSMGKADTVKLVPNTRHAPSADEALRQGGSAPQVQPASDVAPFSSKPEYTPEQKQQAQLKREADIRQLEARLGRLPLFAQHSDGISFSVPVEPRKRSDLPVPLQAVKQVLLIVPVLYNLEPSRIELEGISRDAAVNVEKAFLKVATAGRDTTLLGLLNNLAQNMHMMATTVQEDISQPDWTQEQPQSSAKLSSVPRTSEDNNDRSHIKFIPRPPEWMHTESDSSSGSDTSDSYDSSDAEEGEPGEEAKDIGAPTITERGIMVSFPFLELHGIELLELASLSLTVKCERCKDQKDVKNLKNNENGDPSGMRSDSCKKCSNPFEIGYRQDLIHANSVRAGYLDLEGCTVVDMLPRYSEFKYSLGSTGIRLD